MAYETEKDVVIATLGKVKVGESFYMVEVRQYDGGCERISVSEHYGNHIRAVRGMKLEVAEAVLPLMQKALETLQGRAFVKQKKAAKAVKKAS